MEEALYNKAVRCVRCGGCTYGNEEAHFKEICPINSRFRFFTYSLGGFRYIARSLKEGWLKPSASLGSIVFSCFMCGACGEMCSEWTVEDALELQVALREELRSLGFSPALKAVKKKSPEGKISEGEGTVVVHPGCLALGKENLGFILEHLFSSLELLGEKPALNTLCCGMRFYEEGDKETFSNLSVNLLKKLDEIDAKALVTPCAHCFYAFKKLYRLEEKGIKVMHMVEVLLEGVERGVIKPEEKGFPTLSYHDPCNLGRKTDKVFYELPRKLISLVPGLELKEPERTRENTWCCGGSQLLTNPELSRWVARERAKEIKKTGALCVVTSCTWCLESFSASGIKAIYISELFF